MDTNMTSANMTLVSVIMPAYNCERFIESAIRSVINQTYANWELIVIDDSSTDGTYKIVEKMAEEDERIRAVENKANMGPAYTRNLGVDLSVGEYIAFLDSDDMWRANKLEKQLELITKTQADLAYTSYAIIDKTGEACKKDYIITDTTSFQSLLKENVIGCSTVLLTKDVAQKYRFVSDFYLEDYCLWLDILKDGHKAVGCKDVLVEWRLLANSRSFNKMNNAKKRWKIYREYLHYSFLKSTGLFILYTINGIRKYYI